ncbi:MAG TPA: response regulator [Chloroflexota bacterium]|nr:response regulator [Chloroflexota bacterium]
MATCHRVLVVEDEAPVRELLAYVLRDEGHEVVEARDGAEALRILDSYPDPAAAICVILLDMMLPRVGGLQVLQHLAERGRYIPVIAMSASRRHLQQAEAHGAHATLSKPFELDAVLAAVERTCGHRHAGG